MLCFLGDPLPKVTWWQSGSLFDSSDEVTRMGVIINRMVYKGLSRQDLGKTFTCQAANTNLTVPVSAEVRIIINRKYMLCFILVMLLVHIVYANRIKRYSTKIVCLPNIYE